MKLDDIKGSLGDTFQRYWKPALAGAAIGGTTAGYLSRDAGKPGETPGTRRRRMLRNALAGVLLGGTAGLAIPAGARAVSEPWSSDSGGLLDKAIGFPGKHLAGAAVAGGAGAAMYKAHKLNQAEGLKNLSQNFNRAPGALEGLKTPEALRAGMHGDPSLVDKVKNIVQGGIGHSHPELRAAEQMAEAGFHTPWDKTHFSGLLKPNAGFDATGTRALLSEGGMLSRGLSKLPGARTGHALEIFRRLSRPTIKGRLSLPTQVVAALTATLLANRAQNKLLGE